VDHRRPRHPDGALLREQLRIDDHRPDEVPLLTSVPRGCRQSSEVISGLAQKALLAVAALGAKPLAASVSSTVS
jgi:hypothetical protein